MITPTTQESERYIKIGNKKPNVSFDYHYLWQLQFINYALKCLKKIYWCLYAWLNKLGVKYLSSYNYQTQRLVYIF